MSFTRVVGPGIHSLSNINSHNIHSSGIITATKFDGPFDSINVSGAATFTGSVTIGGTLTYEDVTNIDSVGLITARKGIISSGVVTATAFHGPSQVGIQSGGVQIGAGITQLNFIGLGNTFAVNGTTVDVSISGNSGAGGTWSSYTAGIATTKSVGINTNNLDDNDLVGVGNSFQGLYISNGMMITDNKLSGNHYIGTAFNGLMAGPVNIEGTLTIDGNYVVV